MLYIGIDLGTSAVKLLLMEEGGKVLKTVSRDYPCAYPHPGWSEQDPALWYENTVEGLKELLKETDRSEVAGIGIAGQMHGLVLLDNNDNVLRPAILWNDGRSSKENDHLNDRIGREQISKYTGNISFTGFTASKLLWVKNNEPAVFSRIKRIMLPKDYLAYRLTGISVTDYSDASGMLLLDVKNRRWSPEMLDICSVKEDMLPHLHESYEVIGTLAKEAAEELDLKVSVKVVAGAGDNAASAVGTGTVGDGKCNLSLGTSGTLFISSKKFLVDKHNALHAFANADGHYHLMGCILSAAACNKWWMDDILRTKDYAAEQQGIGEELLGNNRVFFLPYLMGERSPHNDPKARAAFIGMSMDTQREYMTAAVLEGVAFALRDCMEIARSLGLDIERSTIVGGGAKSPLWKKMIANIMDISLDVPENEEGPSLGAAMLSAVGCGAYKDVNEAAEHIVKVRETLEPQKELVKRYDEKYHIWREYYPALKDI